MGKGKRNKTQRQARRQWSVRDAARSGLAWRAKLAARVGDREQHYRDAMDDHGGRLLNARDVASSSDDLDEVDTAWLSFSRPLLRLRLASGLDTTDAAGWVQRAAGDSRAVLGSLQEAVEADRLCDVAAFGGPLYVIAPDVHVVLAACAASLSGRDTLDSLMLDDLPAQSGMLILPDRAPWVGRDSTRALTWHYLPRASWDPDSGLVVPSLRCKGYVHSSVFYRLQLPAGHQVGVQDPDTLLSIDRDVGPCLGDLSPDEADGVMSHLGWAAEQRQSEEVSSWLDRADEIGRDAIPEREVLGEARLDRPTGEPIVLSRYMAAFIRALDQEIIDIDGSQTALTSGSSVVPGPPRLDSDIEIIRLRRRPAPPGEEGSDQTRPARWSHRWVVQMHRVRQWYPKEQRHKIIWRGPYIKGPAGAPLKEPRQRVHALID